MSAPFLSFSELERLSAVYHQHGKPIVLVTGCFDVLHVGHIDLLEAAMEKGTVFVGINNDESVRILKGSSRPVNNLKARAKIISALNCVDMVFPIEDVTVVNAIRTVRPAYWFKGADYTIETLNQDEVKAAKEVGAEIVLVPFTPQFSSSKIIDAVRAKV